MGTINVDSDESIQATINNEAESDDTVDVAPGTYDESVTVNVEGLTLEGPNAGLVTDSDDRGTEATVTQGIEVNASGVTLDGLDVTNSDVNGIVITEAPSNVTVTNTVVRDITGGTAGASKGVGNGINLQFNDVFGQTSTSIEVTNNLITGVTTPDASGNSPDADAIGVQLLPRGNDVVDLQIEDNTIKNIQPGNAPGGRSEARAVSIATQFTDTSGGTRGDFGQAKDLTVADNDVSNLTADFARAMDLFEDAGGDTTTNNALGPVNFTVTGNSISGVDSTGQFFDLALFIGSYSDFGDSHSVQNNDFDAAGIENFGDSDALDVSGNTFSGDTDVYYLSTNANLDTVFSENTFNTEVVVGNTAITRPPNSGEVLNVDQVASFSSIQNAAGSASAGNTIAVGSGTFDESVTINTDGLTLKGPNASLKGPNSGTPGDDSDNRSKEAVLRRTVTVDRVSGVTIDGFKIDGTSLASGVSIRSGSRDIDSITVKNNIISGMSAGNSSDFTFGILSFDNPNTNGGTLSNATIKNNKISDIGVDNSTQGVAISLEALTDSGSNTLVDGNSISNINTPSKDSPGTGIALRPNFDGTDSDAEVTDDNTFENVDIAVSHPEEDDVTESLTNVATVVVDDIDKPKEQQRIFTPTIQNAVDAAEESDTINVREGTFDEKVDIGKNITLTEDNNTNTPTISGQVRITDSVGSSNTLEVSDLDIDYDSGVVSNSGKSKSTVFFEQTDKKKQNITIRNNTITGPDGTDGFAVYKRKSRGDPDDDITFEDNTFDAGSNEVNQLVVVRAANHDSSNEINIIDNIFSGDVNRNNISDTEKGSALDHRADDGEIKNNNFDGGQNLSRVTGPEPLASATGDKTSIRHKSGGNRGLVLEGDSEAGNNIQTVVDESDSDEIVRITDEGNGQSFSIAQNGSSPNQNQIEINAANVTLEGSGSGTNEIRVPDSGPAIDINDKDNVDIKKVGITDSSSGGDTGIVISGSSSNCTVRDNTITVNPNAAIAINGGSNNVIEDNSLEAASGGGAGVLINNAGSSGSENLIALNDIDSDFNNGIKIDSSASNVGNVKVRFNNIRGDSGKDSNAIDNDSGTDVDARSNFWNDKTGPSGGVDDPNTGRTANGEGDAISSNVRYDEFLEIPNGFILDTGRDTDGDNLHEDFNDDSDHFPTDGYLFLRALRQGHFDRLKNIDGTGGKLSTDYSVRFDFDGDGADDITRDDVNEMVINRNR